MTTIGDDYPAEKGAPMELGRVSITGCVILVGF